MELQPMGLSLPGFFSRGSNATLHLNQFFKAARGADDLSGTFIRALVKRTMEAGKQEYPRSPEASWVISKQVALAVRKRIERMADKHVLDHATVGGLMKVQQDTHKKTRGVPSSHAPAVHVCRHCKLSDGVTVWATQKTAQSKAGREVVIRQIRLKCPRCGHTCPW